MSSIAKIAFLISRTHHLENPSVWSFILMFGVPAAITYLILKMSEEERADPNIVMLFLSAFSPLIGIIAYFVRLNHDKKSAQMYLASAGISFVFNLILFILF